MDTNYLEKWQEYNRNALASAKELEVINSEVIEKLTGQQMELANAAFETGSKYLSTITEAKGYQDVVAEQTRLVSEYNEKLIESARATADILAESREAYQAWMEKSVNALAANVEFIVPTFKQPAAKKTTRKAA